NRRGLQLAVGGRQRLSGDAAVPGLKFALQEVGEDAQSGKVAFGRWHRDEAGPLVNDREGGIQVEQRYPRMNLPARTTREGGGVAAAQLEGIAGVGNGLVGLSNDHAIDAHATRENPLFGATLRSLR